MESVGGGGWYAAKSKEGTLGCALYFVNGEQGLRGWGYSVGVRWFAIAPIIAAGVRWFVVAPVIAARGALVRGRDGYRGKGACKVIPTSTSLPHARSRPMRQ